MASAAVEGATPSTSASGASGVPDAAPWASTDAGEAPVLPPLPRAVVKTHAGKCGEEWADARLANAVGNRHEIVRVPYSASGFMRNMVPGDQICSLGVSFDLRGEVDPFRGKAPWNFGYPELAPPAVIGVADGWYKHDRVKQKFDDGVRDLPVFVVWHVKPAEDAGDPAVIAELDDDEIDVPQLHDDRPWLLVLATLPYDVPRVDDEAGRERSRAVAAGFAGADVIDTRQTTELFCCSRVVVAGRYATEKEANAGLGQAKRTWATAYVRRAWGVPRAPRREVRYGP